MATVCHRPVAAATTHDGDEGERADELGGADRHDAGGDGSGALHRVQPVGLDVEGVVPQVEPARRQAEGDEREERLPELRPVVEHARRAGSGEHEQVLAPLQWPGGADAGRRPTTPGPPERPLRRRRPRRRSRHPHPVVGVGEHRARRRPSRRRPTARPRPDRRGGRRARRGAVRPWRHRDSFPHRARPSTVRRRRRPARWRPPSGCEAEVLGDRAQVDGVRRRHQHDVVAGSRRGDGGWRACPHAATGR